MADSPTLELVVKRTFLDVTTPPKLERYRSDSGVRYGFGRDQDDVSTCGGSLEGGSRFAACESDDTCDSARAGDGARSAGEEDGQSSGCAEEQTPGSAAAPEPESPRCWPEARDPALQPPLFWADLPRTPCRSEPPSEHAQGPAGAWSPPSGAWAAATPGYAQELPQGWPEPHGYLLLPAPVYFYGRVAVDAGTPWCQGPSPPQTVAVAQATSGAEEAAEPEPEQHADEARSSGGSGVGKGRSDQLSDEWPGATTLCIQNLPNDYTHAMLEELLDERGFSRAYDFMYLPVDFKRKTGLGYAFVNLTTHDAAVSLKGELEGFKDWEISGSSKVCHVGWATEKYQGLKANIEQYRNNSVMHEDVDQKWQPAIYKSGVRVAFPSPTKKVRRPRAKHATDPRWRGKPAAA